MGDFGIKIAKEGKNILSTNVDDYIFWTKYKPLMFLEKRTDTITLLHGEVSGSTSISHGYDFSPFCMAYILSGGNAIYSIPFVNNYTMYANFQRWGDSGGENVYESIGMRINNANIIFDWESYSFNDGEGIQYPATTYDGSYDVVTYIYNLELGRLLPDN